MRLVRVLWACLLGLRLLGGVESKGAQSPAPPPPARVGAAAPAPPATDIFLFEIGVRAGAVRLGPMIQVTDRSGYDDQPAFSPDGRTLFFTAIQAGNADVQAYELATREAHPVRSTPESEFSPTPAPDGGLSVIRVEEDGAQRLFRLPAGDGAAQAILPELKQVGYHAWADADTLVLFVLGDPPTLQLADRRSGRLQTLAKDVGRCLRPLPGRHAVSFVQKLSPSEWWLEALELPSRKTSRLVRMPEGAEDYAWLSDGRLLVGQGALLLERPPGAQAFRPVARFQEPALQAITRLAVSPRDDRLALVSEEVAPFPLTVDNLMRGPELVGYAPTNLRFAGDSREVYFEWRHAGEDEPATYVAARDGSGLRRLSDEERRLAPGPACEWDAAHRNCLFVDKGDLVLVDSVARTRRQLTRTTAIEASPHFLPGEAEVSFVRDGNLYRIPLSGHGDLVLQITEAGPKKKEPKLTGSQQFLKDEERKLLKHVEDAAERRKRDEASKEREAPPRLELADGESILESELAAGGRFAFLVVAQKAEGARTAEVPNYVTESAYAEMIQARTKVGDKQEARRLAILDTESRKSVWAWVEGVGAPEPAKGEEEGKGEAPETKPKAPPASREVRFSLPLLSRDGRRAVASVRAADNKDRWLVLLDPATGAGRVLDRQHDEAWVREPFQPSFGWLDDSRLWFVSEATGFLHLYVLDAAAATPTPAPLTSGRFEVTDVRLSPRRTKLYVTTNEAHPGERHLYSVPVAGGPLTRLTSRRGAHAVEVSPDEASLADVYSNGATPPELYVSANRADAEAQQVTTSTRPAFRTRRWLDPPVVSFPARDGTGVPARLYTPEDVGARPDPLHPGVVFIHGAGYLQNAHRYWSSYYREYLFHQLLASRGYVVLDLDYRGSAGYGRDWRAAIASHMGGQDLEDVLDGARYLAEQHGVDPKRIGVYGGSYGGFLTLMAMFTSPGTFAAGAALRPVTDWAHYNHPYTANILGEPPADAEAYRRSSPIHFAEGLLGSLLICHGMVDTNVHFQDSVRLAQRLIELRKENWELAVYPVENHGFEEAASWADEYKRILKLFEATLRGRAGSS